MTTEEYPYDDRRPILLAAVRELVHEARTQRALLAEHSWERHFYLGVEAAAREVLDPQLAVSRNPDWLDRESQDFREGYHRAATALASAATSTEPPRRIPLPDPGRPA